MKRIFNLLLCATIAIAYTSCKNEVDDVFDKSSALRMETALKEYNTTLQSPANGWRMEYYGGLEYGGYTMFLKFNPDNTVTVSNEIYGGDQSATTHYKLEQSAGVVLSFDEYNKIFHFFSDPANPLGIGTNGKGMEGDLEFRMQTVRADSVIMTGKKHGARIVMTPATEDWSSYINEVAESETEMAFGSYFFRVGDEVATVAANYRQMTFSYTDEEGVANSIEAPYIVRPNAIHFYNPVSIFGKTITDLTYVGGEDYLFTSNDPEAQMNGYVPPVSEALTSGNWYICYANLSAAIQQYWDYAAPRLLAKEGEKLGYAYLSGNLFYIQSGGYWSAFDFGATIDSDTQVTYALKGYGGSSAQQGNASYYWNDKDGEGVTFFRYFISPLVGTFELEPNDIRNPTMIRLTNVKNPDMYYIVTKQSYPATTGM